ncbi:unnamed protein product [Ectocarpus sp. 6 AP-2014]
MVKSGTVSTRYWRVLRNFADGSCAIYALMQGYLFLNGEHHQDAERVFTGQPTPALREHIRQLVRLCRQATARNIDDSDPSWVVGTTVEGGSASRASRGADLTTTAAFREAILNVDGEGDPMRGWYDERAVLLLAKVIGIEVQVVRKISNRGGSWYETVDGTGPVRAPVLLLWSGRIHYETMVPRDTRSAPPATDASTLVERCKRAVAGAASVTPPAATPSTPSPTATYAEAAATIDPTAAPSDPATPQSTPSPTGTYAEAAGADTAEEDMDGDGPAVAVTQDAECPPPCPSDWDTLCFTEAYNDEEATDAGPAAAVVGCTRTRRRAEMRRKAKAIMVSEKKKKNEKRAMARKKAFAAKAAGGAEGEPVEDVVEEPSGEPVGEPAEEPEEETAAGAVHKEEGVKEEAVEGCSSASTRRRRKKSRRLSRHKERRGRLRRRCRRGWRGRGWRARRGAGRGHGRGRKGRGKLRRGYRQRGRRCGRVLWPIRGGALNNESGHGPGKREAKKLPVPPQLPHRPSTITPHSSGPGGAPPPLPPRPATIAPSPSGTGAPPPMAPTTVPVPQGLFYTLKKYVKDMSDKISPSGEYEIIPANGNNNSVVITGRKTSLFLLISVIVSIMMAVIPILTDDTKTYTCGYEDDSLEEGYCVVDSDNNTSIYVFLAFYQYPWVLFLFFKTGLWVNASGINAKVNGLYGHYLMWDTCNPFKWNKIDFVYFLDFFYYFGSLLSFLLLFFNSICICEKEDDHVIKTILFIAVFFMYAVVGGMYSWLLRNEGLDPEHRMKRLTRMFFFFEMSTSGLVYVDTYGVIGVIFLIIPVLGYIESFGVFEFYQEGDSGNCCLVC